jgi:hypothetical protein
MSPSGNFFIAQKIFRMTLSCKAIHNQSGSQALFALQTATL